MVAHHPALLTREPDADPQDVPSQERGGEGVSRSDRPVAQGDRQQSPVPQVMMIDDDDDR